MKTLLMYFMLLCVCTVAYSQTSKQPTKKQIRKDSLARLEKRLPLDPNRMTKNELTTKFKLRAEIAAALIKGRPYQLPLDVFRNKDLNTSASFKELSTIIAGARATLLHSIPARVVSRKIYSQKGEIWYGEQTDSDGKVRYFISDRLGNEFISAERGNDAKLMIDLTTVRIFGAQPWDLDYLKRDQREQLSKFLTDSLGKQVLNLWQQLEPAEANDPSVIPISSLSQVLSTGYQFSVSPDCGKTNGCTSGPDLNFKSCCDAHDVCYCTGGGSGAQQKCDEELRKCIADKGHWALDDIYSYLSSVFGGAAHFGPTLYTDNSGPATTLTQPSHGPKDCRVIVKLIYVEYGGDYIGNDWTYSVAVNGNSTRILNNGTHNHKATRSYGKILHDKVVTGGCGNTLNLTITGNAREEDSLDDDKGSATVMKSVTCTAGQTRTYRHLLEVSVKEAINFWPDDHGKLYFMLEITIQCQ